jgi:hypothetical protein
MAVLAVAACSSGSGSGGPSVSLETACADMAQSQCENFKACSPNAFDRTYPDVSTCAARTKPNCAILAGAAGSGYEAAAIEACAKAMAATSCAAFANNMGPAACRIRGTLPLGAGCSDDSQCAGDANFCKLTITGCGECAPRKQSDPNDPNATGDCYDNSGCLEGLVCSVFECVPALQPNSPCGISDTCMAPYACVGGTCVMPTLGPGAACDYRFDGCDPNQRLYCLNEMVCGIVPIVHLGEVCGIMNNLDVGCGEGTACDATAGNYTGHCVPRLADGAACDNSVNNYDQCQPPASCTDGFCNLPGPLVCPSADAGTD